MKRITVILFLLVILAIPSTSFALDLSAAKSQGVVGETLSGYLAATSSNSSSEVKGLVASINAQRKAKYQEIANGNGTSLATVEKLAGKKAVENTSPGNFVKYPGGNWVRK